MVRKNFLISLSTLLISFMLTGYAFATDIDLGEGYHAPDGFSSILITNSDGTAIQNAVDHIKDYGVISLSGDFLLKREINIKKNLTLKGIGNALLSRDTKVPHFCIIRCEGNNDITLENLTIIGGQKSRGGGINISGGRITIISCDIHDNFAFVGGGGIVSLAETETLILKNCDIHNNKCGFLGGGIFIGSPTVTMTDCKITSNDSAMAGGGVHASNSDFTMTNCTIKWNRSTLAGTGVKVLGTELKTINCDISDNFVMSKDQKSISNPDFNISCEGNSTYTRDGKTVEGK